MPAVEAGPKVHEPDTSAAMLFMWVRGGLSPWTSYVGKVRRLMFPPSILTPGKAGKQGPVEGKDLREPARPELWNAIKIMHARQVD